MREEHGEAIAAARGRPFEDICIVGSCTVITGGAKSQRGSFPLQDVPTVIQNHDPSLAHRVFQAALILLCPVQVVIADCGENTKSGEDWRNSLKEIDTGLCCFAVIAAKQNNVRFQRIDSLYKHLCAAMRFYWQTTNQ